MPRKEKLFLNFVLNKVNKVIIYICINFLGFTQIIESGYDEEHDLYYIIMNKLDEDLNSIIL